MSGSDDFQALLASLKSHSDASGKDMAKQDSDRRSPFPSATLFQSQPSPALASSSTARLPHPYSSKPSPVPSGGPPLGNERSQSLLNLLKFSDVSSGAVGSSTSAGPSSEHAPEVVGKATLDGSQQQEARRTGSSSEASSQDALLKLLQKSVSAGSQSRIPSRPKANEPSFNFNPIATSNNAATKSETGPGQHPRERPIKNSSPVRMFGTSESRETTPFELPPTILDKEKQPNLSYTNIEDDESKHAASYAWVPRAESPVVFSSIENPLSNAEKRKPEDGSTEPANVRRKLTPKAPLRNSRARSKDPAIKKEKVVEGVSNENGSQTNVTGDVKIKTEEVNTSAEIAATVKQFKQTGSDLPPKDTKGTEENDPQAIVPESAATQSSAKMAGGSFYANLPLSTVSSVEAPPRVVPVYLFPLQPFISLTITALPPSEVELRQDGIMEISRFKKDFDQLDGTLASASGKYISYSLVKQGGLRFIRQDDGSDSHVFKGTNDRIFNVAVSTTAQCGPPSDDQAVIGTGLSGNVYYATISKEGNDLFEKNRLAAESLVFPPYPVGEVNLSHGVMKTRARRSSRHPEFFAIGRGGSIRIVWPATAMHSRYGVDGPNRVVDVEKFYADRSLKITTSKSEKDFVFSEDDTVIASLNKAGKLRFWDIRSLIEENNATATKVQSENVTIPILTYSTVMSNEKPWPTSVLFFDKSRAYTKGFAQRYAVVGHRQNHSLRLWDLALGKVVQEVNLPHSSETDGPCTVSYSPVSGFIVVGHPTRNSIFLLQVSLPRYSLPAMNQATYLQKISNKESQLPPPEATACLISFREVSFAAKGNLRSIDLLPIGRSPDETRISEEDQTLFELYVVYSKGVTCLAIKREDLGWDVNSKPVQPVDNVVETGIVKVGDLNAKTQTTEDVEVSIKTSKKKSSKPGLEGAPEISAKSGGQETPSSPTTVKPDETNGVNGEASTLLDATQSQSEKKKKKKGTSSTAIPTSKSVDPRNPVTNQPSSPTKPSSLTSDQNNNTTHPKISKPSDSEGMFPLPSSTRRLPLRPRLDDIVAEGLKKAPAQNTAVVAPKWIEEEMRGLEERLTLGFGKNIDALHRRLDDERRVVDAAANARQEAVLRLVSSSLSENVENTLNQIISDQVEERVVPAISASTSHTVHTELDNIVTRALKTLIPQQIESRLGAAITNALQSPVHVRAITDGVLNQLQATLSTEFYDLLKNTITPTFKDMAVEASLKVTLDMESRFAAKLRRYEVDRLNDNAKIEQLHTTLKQMADILTQVSHTQLIFQDKMLKGMNRPADVFPRPGSSAMTAIHATPQSSRQVSSMSVQPSPIGPPQSGRQLSSGINPPPIGPPQPGRQLSSGINTPAIGPPQPGRQFSTGINPSPIGPPQPGRQLSSGINPPPIGTLSTQLNPQAELEEIRGLLEDGRFEAASIKWLQSSRSADVFDLAFVHYSPDFLETVVSPLVAFSIGVTVAGSFDRNVQQRLEWIDRALSVIDVKDPEIVSLAEHAPALLESMLSKLEYLYGSSVTKQLPHHIMQLCHAVIMKASAVKTTFTEDRAGRRAHA